MIMTGVHWQVPHDEAALRISAFDRLLLRGAAAHGGIPLDTLLRVQAAARLRARGLLRVEVDGAVIRALATDAGVSVLVYIRLIDPGA